MQLTEIATRLCYFSQKFANGEIDASEFKSTIMTLAFTAAGVSNDEMEVFNSTLQALYAMKKIGRLEVLDVVKNVSGDPQEIVTILESEPIRQMPAMHQKVITEKES